MMSRTVLACMSTALLLALPLQAQGVVKGAQEGAAVGNKAAGPVGGAVGGASREENCSTWTRVGPKIYRDSDGIAFTAN
jgi:hypothetical protein